MQTKISAICAIAFLSLLSDNVVARNNSPSSTHSQMNGEPEVVSRSSGEVEVRMPSGCVALYDKSGGHITRGSSCSTDR